jgi:3'-phosphoadenosine 5'-phosphosulfate sulfotransferase (PAPS reductase)/FAD synthetase
MKKKPLKEITRRGFSPMTGQMAYESEGRLRTYLQHGCNNFTSKRPISHPLGFWTEQNILQYLRDFQIPYSSIYGDIAEHDGMLATTGLVRTGCMFCMFGVHMEHGENRFMRMHRTHPKLWDYCVNKLGCGKVLGYIGVPVKGLPFEEDVT